MYYDYGYGALENQLIDTCKQFPPDFDAIRVLIERGANINATKGPLSDADENLLAEIILFYPETQSAIEHRCGENDIPYDDSPYDGPFLPADADGRYLPQIIALFLAHGYRAKSKHGAACLRNLMFASQDSYILMAAKLLLQAGANPNYTEGGETVLSSIAGEVCFQSCESNQKQENLYESLYQIMDAYLKGRDYWGIEYYGGCIGLKIDNVCICRTLANAKKPIFSVTSLTSRHKNCFCSPIIFSCEGKPLCVTQYANILVNPNIVSDTGREICDISSYFKGCIGHTILRISFEHNSICKGTTSYGQPIILIVLDSGKTIRISTNYGEVSKENTVCFFDVLKSERF